MSLSFEAARPEKAGARAADDSRPTGLPPSEHRAHRRFAHGAEPELTALGRLLPTSLQDVIQRQTKNVGLGGVLGDLFLTHPPDPLGLDPAVAKRWFFVLDQTLGRYFRPTVIGAENLPAGRCLVVGCHSGVMPYDAACLVLAIRKHTGRFARAIGDRFFGRHAAIERLLRACGAMIGEPAAVEAALRRDELVVVFPGGALDMCRPIWERYRVRGHRGFAPGHGGYVKAALRTGSPIVPVAIVGAEETHLMLGDVAPVARLLGVPFFPIIASPLPLPAHLYLRFGAPIHLPAPPGAAEVQSLVDRLNRDVRRTLQALIDDTVRRRRGIYWSTYVDDRARPSAQIEPRVGHGR
jgi:1-acyl-sn-glycerol-3-phosphate acyltransferase